MTYWTRRIASTIPRRWLIVLAAVVSLFIVVGVSILALSGSHSRVQTSSDSRTLQRIRELTRRPSPTPLPSAMPEPVPGGLARNAVITDRQFLADDQLFGRGGRGIVVVVDNRNYAPVEVVVEGTLYDGETVIQEIPGGPYRMDPRQTILIPLKADPSLRPTHFGIKVVKVTPARSSSPSP